MGRDALAEPEDQAQPNHSLLQFSRKAAISATRLSAYKLILQPHLEPSSSIPFIKCLRNVGEFRLDWWLEGLNWCYPSEAGYATCSLCLAISSVSVCQCLVCQTSATCDRRVRRPRHNLYDWWGTHISTVDNLRKYHLSYIPNPSSS
jgi:hypothetical protein